MNAKVKRILPQVILNAVIIILLVMLLFPLFMALWNAFKSQSAYDANKWLPSLPLRINNIAVAFADIDTYLYNTLIVAVAGTGGMLFLSSMASFAMAKVRFYGSKVCFAMIMVLMMVPSVLTLVPSYMLYRELGLYNNLMALILPIWTGGCVFAVFLLVTMFRGLPNELFEAASIDGANTMQKYFFLALPLSLPILGTITIMQISNIWNDFIWPQLILESDHYTISAGLKLVFERGYTYNMPVMFAGYLVASSPIIVLFVAANKFYIQGLVSTAIKM